MKRWSKETEDQIALLIKDWLRNKNKTQADLREELHASSSRMPFLLEVLQKEYSLGGITKVAARLCSIESNWSAENKEIHENQENSDPFNQLDLLLEELQEDLSP